MIQKGKGGSEPRSYETIAISEEDFDRFGCPYDPCQSSNGFPSESGHKDAGIWLCFECSKMCIILKNGVTKSPIAIDTKGETTIQVHGHHPGRRNVRVIKQTSEDLVYPELTPHYRKEKQSR